MSQTDPDNHPDIEVENYPSYAGWEVHCLAPLHEFRESPEEAVEQIPESADAFKEKSKPEILEILPVSNSEEACNL
ncbi:hypothetical protein [Leptolyngbya ohadii]|uniref:hypothetical protein n=1 Tax=Leptolyngbya ohadii TaxID=1962290 RepID=UPI000B59D6B8|nr:hypothetical protein [Leptolyngbya ohadii]